MGNKLSKILCLLPFITALASCSGMEGLLESNPTDSTENTTTTNDDNGEETKSLDTKKRYAVSFYNDEELLDTLEFETGTKIDKDIYSPIPTYPNDTSGCNYTYTFLGWNATKQTDNIGTASTYSLKKDMTLYAVYSRTAKQYRITFKNYNGTELYSKEFDYNTRPEYKADNLPIRPSEEVTVQGVKKLREYTFVGWYTSSGANSSQAIAPNNLPLVTKANTYFAIFSYSDTDIKNKYTIKFLLIWVELGVNEVLQSDEIEEGTVPYRIVNQILQHCHLKNWVVEK